MTASSLILQRLEFESNIAIHEFKIMGCSDTAISARLRELAREGKVIGRTRKGTSYKEWSLVREPEQLQYEKAAGL